MCASPLALRILASGLIRMLAKTARHAGQAGIVREPTDKKAGNTEDQGGGDPAFWTRFTSQNRAAAETVRPK